MTVYAYVTSVPHWRGRRLISGFHLFNDDEELSLNRMKHTLAGMVLIATFNQHQRVMYEECCKTFTWLGQSKPIKNPNSGNYIFTAVFKA